MRGVPLCSIDIDLPLPRLLILFGELFISFPHDCRGRKHSKFAANPAKRLSTSHSFADCDRELFIKSRSRPVFHIIFFLLLFVTSVLGFADVSPYLGDI